MQFVELQQAIDFVGCTVHSIFFFFIEEFYYKLLQLLKLLCYCVCVSFFSGLVIWFLEQFTSFIRWAISVFFPCTWYVMIATISQQNSTKKRSNPFVVAAWHETLQALTSWALGEVSLNRINWSSTCNFHWWCGDLF